MSMNLFLAIADTCLGCAYMYNGDYLLGGLWLLTGFLSWGVFILDHTKNC